MAGFMRIITLKAEAILVVCMLCAMVMPARSVEWHCANVGTGDELRGRVLSDEFCFQAR